MTLGVYPKITLSEAHELHAKARQKLEKGVDPGIESVKRKRQAREAYTVAELVHDYIERHAKKKKKSWKEDQRILNKDVIPRWKKRKAAPITRLDVVNLLDEVRDRAVYEKISTFLCARVRVNYFYCFLPIQDYICITESEAENAGSSFIVFPT